MGNKNAVGATVFLTFGVLGIVSGYTNPIWWQAIASTLSGAWLIYLAMTIIISK